MTPELNTLRENSETLEYEDNKCIILADSWVSLDVRLF